MGGSRTPLTDLLGAFNTLLTPSGEGGPLEETLEKTLRRRAACMRR
jgi:hypothetical protein